MKNFLIVITALCTAAVFYSCTKDLPNQSKSNQTPATRLWLVPESDLKETVSKQHLYYYGEDPDGSVSGFLLAVVKGKNAVTTPDTIGYTWTTRTDTVLALPLLSARDSFTVVVRAVDNRFAASTIPQGAIVHLSPVAYWDVNANGMKDGADVALPAMEGAVDTKGAIQLFPIRNTPPKVMFAVNPVDSSTIQQPDTTYTVATFSWVGSDEDGNATIASYRIALNDTSNAGRWFTINGNISGVTLIVPRTASDAAGAEVDAEVYTGTYPSLQYRGKVTGLRLNAANTLFLQSRDIAGEYSPAAKLPATSSKKWFVKKPQGRMLVVADYTTSDKNDVIAYYRNIFSSPQIARGSLSSFDVLDRVNLPSSLNPALIKTLQLYDVVLWMTDRFPSIKPAQIGLFNYTQSGGKVIFTTTFATDLSYSDLRALNDFAPLDSITTDVVYPGNRPPTNADNRLNARTQILPMQPGYPVLAADTVNVAGDLISSHTLNVKRIYKRTDSQYIYRLDSSRASSPRYKGSPEIACIDNAKRFVMFALPLHIVNGAPRNLPLFFKQVIENEFGIK
ncbi:MAG: hypothetical protein ACM3Q4_11905 [Acidobacteriota bacterium]